MFPSDQSPKSFSESNDLEKYRRNKTGDKQIPQILLISMCIYYVITKGGRGGLEDPYFLLCLLYNIITKGGRGGF